MRIARSKRRLRYVLLAFLLLSVTCLSFFFIQHRNKPNKLSQASCLGSESVIKERSEDYVRKFTKTLSKEAKRLEREEEVHHSTMVSKYGRISRSPGLANSKSTRNGTKMEGSIMNVENKHWH